MKLSRSLLCSAFVCAVSSMLAPAAFAESYSSLPLGPTIYVNPAEVSGDAFLNIVSTEHGGAVRVTEGTTTIQDSSFSAVSTLGLGGAIYVGDSAAVMLQGDVTFAGNLQKAEEKMGVYTGLFNDIYLGADATLTIDNESGKMVSLGSGVASADASASIVKRGAGNAVIGAGADNSGFAGSIAVEAGTMALLSDMTLSSFSVEKGASVSVSGATVGVGANGVNVVSIESTGAQAFLSDLSIDSTSLQGRTTGSGMICDAAVVVNNTSEMTLSNLSLQGSSVKLYSSAEVRSVALDEASSLTVYDGTVTLSGTNSITVSSLTSNQLSGLAVSTWADLKITFTEDLWEDMTSQAGQYELTFVGLGVEDGAGVGFDWLDWAGDGTVITLVGSQYTETGVVFTLDVGALANQVIWSNQKKAVWKVGEGGWLNEDGEATTYEDGNDVYIGDGTVSIVGNVAPGDVLLAPTKALTLKTTYDKKNKKYSGAIVGDTTSVTIDGGAKAKVTMNDGNDYAGGTTIKSGLVSAGGSLSFGTGAITITGGSLDLKNKAVANDILLDGAAIVKTGKSYTGTFTMAGGELQKGSVINVVGSTLLGGGVVNGTLSGPGEVKVSGSTVTLGSSAKVTTNLLTIANNGVLEVGTKGLTLNAKASTVSISSGTLISASKMGAYSLTMNGGLVDITNAKPVAMTLTDALTMSNEAKVNLYGAFTAADMKMTDAHFILGMAAADKSEKNKPKTQNFTLKDKNTLSTMENSDLQIDGNMSVAGRLKLTEDSSIRLADPNGKAGMNLTVTGTLDLESSSDIHLTGKLSTSTLTMLDGSTVVLESEKLQSIKLNHATGTSKLTKSTLKANAGMTVKGNLVMTDAHIRLWDAAVKPKAASLTVGGELKMSNGSSLTLDGLLKVGELTLNGATLNLTSTKCQTIVISELLTITGSNDVNFGFSVSQKDVNKKSFTLFSFKKTYLTNKSDLYGLLGLDDEYCTLSIDTRKNTITMTVTDWNAWEAYVQMNRKAWEQTANNREDDTLKPIITTAPAVDAALAKVSDTLVQTTWGAAKSSRAFVGSIESRGQNAASLAGGRGAAWGAALGSSSRLSSHGGALGADYSMSGAAVGAEISATEKHSVGVAMGCTWGRVSTHSAYIADQDTTHFALYGSSSLKKTANGSLSLDWSAAYGRSENDADLVGADYDWTQHSAQLDARLSYARTLNERTVVRAFGGLQYLHVDAATPTAGVKADSMENLRVELGVGATWMATAKTALNGEVSFIGDMLRDNPAAVVGGTCRGGANPGRAGVNVGVGATHQLNESWSVNAGYNLELVPHSTSHNASVGATYRF